MANKKDVGTWLQLKDSSGIFNDPGTGLTLTNTKVAKVTKITKRIRVALGAGLIVKIDGVKAQQIAEANQKVTKEAIEANIAKKGKDAQRAHTLQQKFLASTEEGKALKSQAKNNNSELAKVKKAKQDALAKIKELEAELEALKPKA